MRKPFEEDPEIMVIMERLIREFGDVERGSTLRYKELEPIAGSLQSTRGQYIIRVKLRKWFERERRTTLVAVNGVGYRLETYEEQALDPMERRSGRARRQENRAIKEVSMVPGDMISPKKKMLREEMVHCMKLGRLFLSRVRRIFTRKKDDDMPRPPMD
jgi:hypothetical protein